MDYAKGGWLPPASSTVVVRVDPVSLAEALDNLPEEALERLAAKIERKLLERQRRSGR